MNNEISRLIDKGGVLFNVEGNTTEEIYRNITNSMEIPEPFDSNEIYNALCSREKIMSTAVGNGIAIPHSRNPIIKNPEDQRIYIAYLKNPIDMQAPDEAKVYVMFVVLTQNIQDHRKVLSSFAALFQDASFRKILASKADKEEILRAIQKKHMSE